MAASERDGPIKKAFLWLSCKDSLEIEVGCVVVGSEELGLENSAPGDIDCDKALPWES